MTSLMGKETETVTIVILIVWIYQMTILSIPGWRVSQDNSLVIMGGYDAETVSSDGDSTRRTFNLKYLTRFACSIPLGDEVVLTALVVSSPRQEYPCTTWVAG